MLTDDTNLVGNMFPRIYRVLFISKLSKDPEKESAVGKMTCIIIVTHACFSMQYFFWIFWQIDVSRTYVSKSFDLLYIF